MQNEERKSDYPQQLTGLIILFLLVVLYGFRFFPPLSNVDPIEDSPSCVVEVKGDVSHSGLYFFSHHPTMREVLTSAGATENTSIIINPRSNVPLPGNCSLWVQKKPHGIQVSFLPLEGRKKIILGIPINLNTATTNDLKSIPGIGPGIAEEIVSCRNTRGAFLKVEDIKTIKGIGEKRFKKFERYLTATPGVLS